MNKQLRDQHVGIFHLIGKKARAELFTFLDEKLLVFKDYLYKKLRAVTSELFDLLMAQEEILNQQPRNIHEFLEFTKSVEFAELEIIKWES